MAPKKIGKEPGYVTLRRLDGLNTGRVRAESISVKKRREITETTDKAQREKRREKEIPSLLDYVF